MIAARALMLLWAAGSMAGAAPAVRPAKGGAAPTLVRALPNGAELHAIPLGASSAQVYVDVETLALVRALPAGRSVTVFGSQALEMLGERGLVATTGRLSAASDVDVLGNADEQVIAGYGGRADFVPRSLFDRELRDGYSFARLLPRFSRLADGEIRVDWDNTGGSSKQVARAYQDWLDRRVRFEASGPMRPEHAAQAALYMARYAGMSLEPKTEKKAAAALRRWQPVHIDAISKKIWTSPRGGLDRFDKVFKHAARPQAVLDLLERWGALRGRVGAEILRSYAAAGHATSIDASRLPPEPPSALSGALTGLLGVPVGGFASLVKGRAAASEAAWQAFSARKGEGTFVIFVDGGPWASGKTTFAAELERRFARELGARSVMRGDEDGLLHASKLGWESDFDAPFFDEIERSKPAVAIYARSTNQKARMREPKLQPDMRVYVRATETARLLNFLKRQVESSRGLPWLPPEDKNAKWDPLARRYGAQAPSKLDSAAAYLEMLIQTAIVGPISRLNYALRLSADPPDLIVADSLMRRLVERLKGRS